MHHGLLISDKNNLKKFTRTELRRINYCVLCLDVHTISDIATACDARQTDVRPVVAIVKKSVHAIVLKQKNEATFWSIRKFDSTVSRTEKTLAIVKGRLDDRVYVWSEKSEYYFNYERTHFPYRFTREGLRDELPSFVAWLQQTWNLKLNTFRAVPQSKFIDVDTMIRSDAFEDYIELLHES